MGMSADDWNRKVDRFDVEKMAAQLSSVGAGYFIFTFGQNSGHYCAPNLTYDGIVDREESRLAKRDLFGELADALAATDVRMMGYSPSHAPAFDRFAVERLRCTPKWDASHWQLKPGTYVADDEVDERLTQFQRNWESVLGEWSRRYGSNLHGWWIDGCYYADRMYRNPEGPGFHSLADALRSGNADSIVAFNPGVKTPIVRHSEYEDYTAGEVAHNLPVGRYTSSGYQLPQPHVDGAQYHVLTYLGRTWSRGEPRFNAELARGYTSFTNAGGGVITWDVPTDDTGRIPDAFLTILETL